tara:strand:+ start:392 stop:808 length:417 start_codon:yes stop_codon:yes gene_type:complete
MKFFIFTMMILSIFVIPTAFADAPYIFVQIIHKDSDGNLLGYLQSDRVTDVDVPFLDEMLEHESTRTDNPTYQKNGNFFQVITRENTLNFDFPLMYASTNLVQDVNDEQVVVLRLPHDGLRVLPGDTIKVIWIFARSV